MIRRLRLLTLTLFTVALLKAPEVLACPVCYGSSDDEVIRGAELSVLFMVGVTYALLMGGGVLAVVLFRRRARRRVAEIETY